MPTKRQNGLQFEELPRATRPDAPASAEATRLVADLRTNFQGQVERALDIHLDLAPTSLAFVDHYLRLAQAEDREPIVSLLAAGAGSYFGELIRQRVGGTWIGGGGEPRRLRLLLEPQFIYFSPIDQAYEAIAGAALEPGARQLPTGDPPFDPSFHVRPPNPAPDHELVHEDGQWLEARLGELVGVPEDQFHSLTCRFETLELVLELLAAKQEADGRPPRTFALADYLEILS
jgi:hypothetical protein